MTAREAPKTGAMLLLVAAFSISACDFAEDYRDSVCPKTPYPRSKALLAADDGEGRLGDRLRFHQMVMRGNLGLAHEIWSDNKFEFTASVRYHYDFHTAMGGTCPRGISVELMYPVTQEQKRLAHGVIKALERAMGIDLTALHEGLDAYLAEKSFDDPRVSELGNYIGEVYVYHHPYRGDFIMSGLFDRDFYDQKMRVR
jgi:hypothetical protein